jgi:ABC-type branched-subunit amino acid transport system ATPase component
MTCLENVLAALDARRQANWLGYLVRLPSARREERNNLRHAEVQLAIFGLASRVEAQASELTPGERRLLELARAVALAPRVLLMDEPAAGLNSAEILQLELVLRQLRERGVGILLVEHHADMVMRLADEVTVLDFGVVISRGDAEAVQCDPKVMEAYFGTSLAAAPHLPEREALTQLPRADES